jgi:25S rRNA (adenine2142-N1)-methyltransferase
VASTDGTGGGIIEEIGCLAVYQSMSSGRQGNDRGGRSEEALIQWLIDIMMGLRKRDGRGKLKYECSNTLTRKQALGVVALKSDNYRTCTSWIDTTLIVDPRGPSILEQNCLGR